MSRSERLHNQGNNEQAITPELRLSTELWDTCVKLIDEKGRNKIRVAEIFSRVIFPPINLFNLVHDLTLPHSKLRIRYVYLKGEEREGNTKITMYGVNPNKVKQIRVYVRGIMDETPPDPTFLLLRKGKVAEVKIATGDSLLYSATIPCDEAVVKRGKAKMQDLEAYQRYINQGSPIDYK